LGLVFSSVGDHRPKNLKTGKDPEKSTGRDPFSVAIPENFSGRVLEIFLKIYQDMQLDESNLKFSIGLRPKFGSQPKKFQPGRLVPVATVFGSRSDILEKSLNRSLNWLSEKKVWIATSTGSRSPTLVFSEFRFFEYLLKYQSKYHQSHLKHVILFIFQFQILVC
jgi:hypothetical protein